MAALALDSDSSSPSVPSSPSSPSRAPSPLPVDIEEEKYHIADPSPSPASFPSSLHDHFSARPRCVQFVPKGCETLFQSVCQPLLSAYSSASSRGDFAACSQLLEEFLRIPSLVLATAHQPTTKRNMREFIHSNDRNASTMPLEFVPASAPAVSANVASAGRENADSSRVLRSASVNNVDDMNVRRCHQIMKQGEVRYIHKAARALTSKPLTAVSEEVIEQLRALHPQPSAADAFPPLPTGRHDPLPAVLVDAKMLTKAVGETDNGAAPGPSGWTGNMVRCLSHDSICFLGLQAMVRDLLNGRLMGTPCRDIVLASHLVAVGKTNGGVRPIAMGEQLYKLAVKYAMLCVNQHLDRIFPSIQLGAGQAGGSAKAYHIIRHAYELRSQADPTTVVLSTDFANAFNSISRAKIMTQLLEMPFVSVVCRLFHFAYSKPSPLVVYDADGKVVLIPSQEGTRQGDLFGAFGFAVGVQPMFEKIARAFPNVTMTAILDDLTFVGPQEEVFGCYDLLRSMCGDEYNLSLQPAKCNVLLGARSDASVSAAVRDAASARGLNVVERMVILGGCISAATSDIVEHSAALAARNDPLFQQLTHSALPTQTANLILTKVAPSLLSYASRITEPSLFVHAAAEHDDKILKAFCKIHALDHTTLDSNTKQQIMLPIRKSGMGLRSTLSTLNIQYLCALLQCAAEVRSLERINGGGDMWGEFCKSVERCVDACAEQGIDMEAFGVDKSHIGTVLSS